MILNSVSQMHTPTLNLWMSSFCQKLTRCLKHYFCFYEQVPLLEEDQATSQTQTSVWSNQVFCHMRARLTNSQNMNFYRIVASTTAGKKDNTFPSLFQLFQYISAVFRATTQKFGEPQNDRLKGTSGDYLVNAPLFKAGSATEHCSGLCPVEF